MWCSKAGGLWRKTQRERRREGEERERGRWENSDGKKEWDGGGRFQQAAWNQVIIENKSLISLSGEASSIICNLLKLSRTGKE